MKLWNMLYCCANIVGGVWCKFFKWLGISVVVPSCLYVFLQLWRSFFKLGLCVEFATSIWFSIAWSLWRGETNLYLELSDLLLDSIDFCWSFYKCRKRPVSIACLIYSIFRVNFLVTDIYTFIYIISWGGGFLGQVVCLGRMYGMVH